MRSSQGDASSHDREPPVRGTHRGAAGTASPCASGRVQDPVHRRPARECAGRRTGWQRVKGAQRRACGNCRMSRRDPWIRDVVSSVNIYQQRNGCYRSRCPGPSSWYAGSAITGATNVNVTHVGLRLYGHSHPPVAGVPVAMIPDHVHLGVQDFGPDGLRSGNSYAEQVADLLN